MTNTHLLRFMRRILSIPKPRISSEQALAAVRVAAEQYEWRWIRPVVTEGLRTYVVKDVSGFVEIRGIVDILTGEVLRIWKPGYPVTYYGRPIGVGPWISPQEAGEIVRKEIKTRTKHDWTEPVRVRYSILRSVYVVRDNLTYRDAYMEVEVNPRDGSIRKYFMFSGHVKREGDDDYSDLRDMDEQKARRTLLLVMGVFVEGKYAELAKLLHEEGITVDAIREPVDDYPYRLVMPPDVPFGDLVHLCIRMQNRTSWAVDAKVWTQEEGVSDLVLIMEFTDSPDEYYGVAEAYLHVE